MTEFRNNRRKNIVNAGKAAATIVTKSIKDVAVIGQNTQRVTMNLAKKSVHITGKISTGALNALGNVGVKAIGTTGDIGVEVINSSGRVTTATTKTVGAAANIAGDTAKLLSGMYSSSVGAIGEMAEIDRRVRSQQKNTKVMYQNRERTVKDFKKHTAMYKTMVKTTIDLYISNMKTLKKILMKQRKYYVLFRHKDNKSDIQQIINIVNRAVLQKMVFLNEVNILLTRHTTNIMYIDLSRRNHDLNKQLNTLSMKMTEHIDKINRFYTGEISKLKLYNKEFIKAISTVINNELPSEVVKQNDTKNNM